MPLYCRVGPRSPGSTVCCLIVNRPLGVWPCARGNTLSVSWADLKAERPLSCTRSVQGACSSQAVPCGNRLKSLRVTQTCRRSSDSYNVTFVEGPVVGTSPVKNYSHNGSSLVFIYQRGTSRAAEGAFVLVKAPSIASWCP